MADLERARTEAADYAAGAAGTEGRKPPELTMPGWVEAQIRAAQERGSFDDLPGAGKPIAGLDRPQHELAWVAGYLRRENADLSAVLPPQLALAKEIETLPTRLVREWSGDAVRAAVDDLNHRIRMAHLRPQEGPPLRVAPVDVEAALARWTTDRAAFLRDRAEAAAAARPQRRPARRRWWRRADPAGT